MPYNAPVAEFQFIFDHVVGLSRVTATERYAEAGDLTEAILTEAAKLSDTILAPLQRNGDKHPARLENGVVRTSPGFAEGYQGDQRGRLGGDLCQPGLRRDGPADRADLGGE